LSIFLISGCGLGAYKWQTYFPAFISGFYYKKQEKIALNLQAHSLRRTKHNHSQIKRKMCVERCVLDISLTHKAKLKRMLVGYLVKTSIKGERHQPVRLSNKGRKHLISSSLGVRPLY
jgi:hypothetical protein